MAKVKEASNKTKPKNKKNTSIGNSKRTKIKNKQKRRHAKGS